MKLNERIARIALSIVGVVTIWYVAATPGDQLLFAVIGGACVGLSIGFILIDD